MSSDIFRCHLVLLVLGFVIPFLWILGAMGVAYAAKLSGRTPFLWLLLGIVLTPLGGGLLLSAANKRGWIMRL